MRKSLLALAGILVLLGLTAGLLLSGGNGTADRAHDLDQRLRCPVCKSVSIAESPSETATAMRQAVQDQVAAGRSDQQVLGFFRARYGDWVLLDPPVSGRTLWVWLLPLAGIAAGALLLAGLLRKRPDVPELAGDERARVELALRHAREQGTGETL
ncbi:MULTISPECIES: cytochrome c-type biogenesis protein [Amycolatopsis]|uniref:Cytochrome c-type biogenesis protein n=1 Tax=Amycolatopsis echigonensis TaxID=2576905 RepID=A0A2N3WLB1_9PSEU|nr:MULTISPECIES: cytochrome c-type biogenesis protein [Amycolatopsis]MBB2500843.1 cytochrome c-type biogenesis protein CcmH [Amycolatopsis echigonensis]MCG3751200.1 cytochrome c-type biogenesis protein CcmH [Amycolatopsis sp. Poz14]PKV94663.1 cytochrome c-type biogenesis protein CcmH [Amycolatopsis niigatensis]